MVVTLKNKMKCKICEYQWESRIESPKACPRCKRRFDYATVKKVAAEA